MKKFLSMLLVVLLVASFAFFALASGESETDDQGTASAEKGEAENKEEESNLDNYKVDILSCRLAKDYEGSPVVIVKYKFTNNDDDPASFDIAFIDSAYQDGVELNKAYFLDDSAEYDSDNQMKKIKTGASLEVESAYKLNDSETDVEVEVKRFISFDDSVVTKTFTIK